MTTDPMIAALLRERTGYVLRGLDDRVAEVDAALKARGYKEPAKSEDASRGEESAEPAKGPTGRRAKSAQTAKGD